MLTSISAPSLARSGHWLVVQGYPRELEGWLDCEIVRCIAWKLGGFKGAGFSRWRRKIRVLLVDVTRRNCEECTNKRFHQIQKKSEPRLVDQLAVTTVRGGEIQVDYPSFQEGSGLNLNKLPDNLE